MEKNVIKRLIKKNTCQNFFQDPNIFSEHVIKATANGFWEHRSTKEIKRDELAKVTNSDYEKWVLEEVIRLKTTARKIKKKAAGRSID
jgi:hypothetical protein